MSGIIEQKTGQLSVSQRFSNLMAKEIQGFDAGKQRYAQHLYVAINNSLTALEENRQRQGRGTVPIKWNNVKMEQLVSDSIPIIDLGIDALVGGNVYPIPYLEGDKYRVNLMIGYKGLLLTRQKYSLDKIIDIRVELLYSNDTFRPIMKDRNSQIETYEFAIDNFHNRGELIGGFGYIVYENELKNKLVLVTKKDIQKSRSKAKSDKFWSEWEEEMSYKTVVRKLIKHIDIDPAKVNAQSIFTIDKNDYDERETDVEDNVYIPTPTVREFREAETTEYEPVEEPRQQHKPVENSIKETVRETKAKAKKLETEFNLELEPGF